jgi:glucoamylase
MNQLANSVVFGAPGIELRWASSAKEGVGTAYHTSCRLWFTLSHGIINEIYHPYVDQPNTRDCQFLITDGETFCHEEKGDLDHQIEYPERDCVFYRLTNSEHQDRYRLIKYLLTDPHRLVLLVHTALLGRKVPSPKVVERSSSFAGQRTAHMANSVGHSARQGCPVVQD